MFFPFVMSYERSPSSVLIDGFIFIGKLLKQSVASEIIAEPNEIIEPSLVLPFPLSFITPPSNMGQKGLSAPSFNPQLPSAQLFLISLPVSPEPGWLTFLRAVC